MQSQIRSVGQFFKIMIGSFQQQQPQQFIDTFKLLVKKQVNFPTDKLKSFESLNSYKQGDKDREVYSILDAIRLWAISRNSGYKEKVQGFNYYLNILSHGLNYLEEMKQGQQWFVNCLKVLILFSKRAFDEAQSAAIKIGQSTQIVLEKFFHQLRQYKSSRSIEPQAKRELGLIIQTIQVSINFKLLQYAKCERGLELVKRDIALHRPERLNLFSFQYGKMCLINHKFKESQSWFQKIMIQSPAQRRIVLRYLIPCKIFLGKMCIDKQFPEYLQLTKSIISGNFKQFQQSILRYQKVWIKRGLYLLIEKMRLLVWRNFLKRVSSVLENSKVNLDHIVEAVKLMGGEQDLGQCLCIISNLIFQGYIKGYIFIGETSKILVLKNQGAFVQLSKVFE